MKKILATIPQLSALCVIALISITAISQVKAADSSDDWREEYAYNIGVAAMFYAYPYLRMAEVRYRWTMTDVPYPETQPNHALNTFWHATRLIDTTWKEGGAPNNDTLYSLAWLKVDKEPMILSIPPIDRYFTFEISGFNSDNFAYVSELDQGHEGGNYALLPPGWKGDLPAGVEALAAVGRGVLKSNGWVYSTQLGRTGTEGDFFLRTVHQSFAGIVANDAAEAIYYGGYKGSDGQALNGSKRYRIYLPEGTEPDVAAFWSISLYGSDNNFVANEIDRYSIGDRTPNLVHDEDGGLTIVLQNKHPTDPGVNWLPAPEGPFWLVLRAYQPAQSLQEGSWRPPAVTLIQ